MRNQLRSNHNSSFYPDTSVFTVSCHSSDQKTPKIDKPPPNDHSFDLAVVEFNDDGSLLSVEQKDALHDCITRARHSNPNGALVVVFIHGWHHSARWEDSHHASFRKVLASLALREAERYSNHPRGRRVVGVYLGWHGDPASWGGRWPTSRLTHLSFFNRYHTAKRIGEGHDLYGTVRDIIECTKAPMTNAQGDSPLVLLGHSMGALMLQSALLKLLTRNDPTLNQIAPKPDTPIHLRQDDQPISFPDVVITLNSAADSRIMKGIIEELEQRKLHKRAESDSISYDAPVLISATAKNDLATKLVWRLFPLHILRKTDGHDHSLLTHVFAAAEANVRCEARPGVPDFGQDWSCLRLPQPERAPSPTFPIDLPNDRLPDGSRSSHTRYRLSPNSEQSKLAWIFQLPAHISAGHNDIFNTRSSLLLLSLMQIAGATMSLASNWQGNFEP